MIPVTLDGLEHYAWPYEPEWGRGVKATFNVETDTVSSLTKRENRRAYGDSVRSEVTVSYVVDGATAAVIRNTLRILQDTPVRLPFPPSIDDGGVNFGVRWYLAINDDAVSPYWTTDRTDNAGRQHILATMLGYLAEPPTFNLIDTDTFLVGLRFKESSDFAEALGPAIAATAGPSIGARKIMQFPFLPDFAGEDPGSVVVDVDRQQIGFSRKTASAAYPQLGYRNPTFNYTLSSREEIANLIGFFSLQQGPVTPFWLPCWVEECKLAVDAHEGDATITVNNAAALGDHRYLCLLFNDVPVLRHITAIAGNVLTLDSALEQDFPASKTVLSTLALVRFASGQLTIDWQAPDLATAKISFQEVTQEYLTPLGEDYGKTIGPLPEKAYLFQLKHGIESWYWTNYEQDLGPDEQLYSSTGIEFTDLTDGLAWDTSGCKIKMRSAPGHPLVRLLTRTATDRFELIISECIPSSDSAPTVIFRGWITQAAFDGPWIEADATGFGSLFSRKVPRTLMQPTDNFALFDAGNRLSKADWTFTARLTAVAGNAFTLDTLTWPGGALPAIGDNYFALGYIERPNPVERIPIVGSTAIAGGVLTVTLAHALMNGAAVTPETGWKLVPGYDGLASTALDKFGNLGNFGAFPEVPLKDPSMIPISSGAPSNPSKK